MMVISSSTKPQSCFNVVLAVLMLCAYKEMTLCFVVSLFFVRLDTFDNLPITRVIVFVLCLSFHTVVKTCL